MMMEEFGENKDQLNVERMDDEEDLYRRWNGLHKR
jgi:hypothetical protein